MPNGKPGDHPRTDLTIHDMAVYGEPTDGILKRLIELMGQHRFDEWFNPIWRNSKEEIAEMAKAKLATVEKDALARGWEIGEHGEEAK
ncbi:MAG: hypothetical protein A2Z34_11220 [Planctomycetes bacterium RBG_16_59_8]|nr:MAG: hypothetical protein A2Z34_11220 [Planctomycetes bacterium RBG_16_59_8]